MEVQLFIPIEEYMSRSREERRAHLDLSEACNQIGGAGSSEYKGLLAYFLSTTIPTKQRKIHLCHACNNPICSNPKHLYWGSPTDNHQDKVEAGRWKTVYQCMVEKLGEEGAKTVCKSGGKSSAAKGHLTGGQNKLSEEQLDTYRDAFATVDITKRGWISRAANLIGVSHTQIRRIAIRCGIIQ